MGSSIELNSQAAFANGHFLSRPLRIKGNKETILRCVNDEKGSGVFSHDPLGRPRGCTVHSSPNRFAIRRTQPSLTLNDEKGSGVFSHDPLGRPRGCTVHSTPNRLAVRRTQPSCRRGAAPLYTQPLSKIDFRPFASTLDSGKVACPHFPAWSVEPTNGRDETRPESKEIDSADRRWRTGLSC
jgi:hypothetical protein